MVAEGIRSAYVDLFQLNTSAYNLSKNDAEGKFKTLTNGSKSQETIGFMASTFVNLCSYADWSCTSPSSPSIPLSNVKEKDRDEQVRVDDGQVAVKPSASGRNGLFDLNYDIHIHLPATRDEGVYDALFASLAKHLPLK